MYNTISQSPHCEGPATEQTEDNHPPEQSDQCPFIPGTDTSFEDWTGSQIPGLALDSSSSIETETETLTTASEMPRWGLVRKTPKTAAEVALFGRLLTVTS